jgi:hypothetical protein
MSATTVFTIIKQRKYNQPIVITPQKTKAEIIAEKWAAKRQAVSEIPFLRNRKAE